MRNLTRQPSLQRVENRRCLLLPIHPLQVHVTPADKWLSCVLPPFRDVGGFYGKLITNVFVMPILCFFFCFLLYLNQRRTIATVIAMGGADESAYSAAKISLQQNLFFVIFLTYPMVTATLL